MRNTAQKQPLIAIATLTFIDFSTSRTKLEIGYETQYSVAGAAQRDASEFVFEDSTQLAEFERSHVLRLKSRVSSLKSLASTVVVT